MVLFVDEKESIGRQIKRGRETLAHNDEVRRAGIGTLREDRVTDHDEVLARRRYQAFKEQTWEALESLKEIFHYHFINAQGPIESVEQNILKELRYQSTLELDPQTVDRLRGMVPARLSCTRVRNCESAGWLRTGIAGTVAKAQF
jgi:adenylate kinase